MSDVEVIKLPIRFDYSCHKSFADSCESIIGSGKNDAVILDFSQVDYLDSSALGMIVLMQKKFSAKNRKVKIKGAQGATLEILKMANMQKLFEFM